MKRGVQVHQRHRDATQLRAGDPVLGAGELVDAGDGGLVGKLLAQHQAAQLAMAVQELNVVQAAHGLAQQLFALLAVQEMVLRRSGREHVGEVEHVVVRRRSGRVLRAGGEQVNDALLRLLDAVALVADGVVADEVDLERAVAALFQLLGKPELARFLNLQVVFVEAGGAELQRHQWCGTSRGGVCAAALPTPSSVSGPTMPATAKAVELRP